MTVPSWPLSWEVSSSGQFRALDERLDAARAPQMRTFAGPGRWHAPTGSRTVSLVEQPTATTPAPAAPTVDPAAATTAPAAPTLAPTTEPTTAPPGGTASPSLQVPIIVQKPSAPPPEIPEAMVNASEEKWAQMFEANNPLIQSSMWSWLGLPLVIGMVVLVFLTVNALVMGTNENEVQEDEIVVPENMYGETFSTLLVTIHSTKRDGLNFPLICEMFSTLLLLGVTYVAVWVMLDVAQNTIASVDQDVEERDSLFEKFREPSIWMAQNWTVYPDTSWRRQSMVWFCHDIVYGKTKHVNELGPQWIQFSWVVLVIWLSYMITEIRASLDFLALVWEVPTVPSEQMVEEDEDEGDLKVHGMSPVMKLSVFALIFVPKITLNIMVAVVGAEFLMFNDLDDDLQEILLKTIEMAFILEMDELIYEAFSSANKKKQLMKIQLPIIRVRGLQRVISTYGELPRLVFVITIATILASWMHQPSREANVLTAKQSGVIEGCCNFMEYLKGAGVQTELAEGNPCSSFREGYEAPMGVTFHKARPSNHTNATMMLEMMLRFSGLAQNHTELPGYRW